MKKRISYNYLFNYFGDGTYEGKPVMGASLFLSIKPFKDGKEVLFKEGEEPGTHGRYLSQIFDVGFDRDHEFKVSRDLRTDNLFRLAYGWDSITYEITGYALDIRAGFVGDMEKSGDLPDNIKDMPVSESVDVTEEQFREFLFEHKDDFDISDNIQAQVPCRAFIDAGEDGVS